MNLIGSKSTSRVSPHRRMLTLDTETFSKSSSMSVSPRLATSHKTSPWHWNHPRRHDADGQNPFPYEEFKQNLIEFVRDHFKRKECIHFVPDPKQKRKPNDPVKCCCGETSDHHIKGTAGIPEFYISGRKMTENDLGADTSDAKWKASDDILEFPTNAFGKLDFIHEGLGGRKASKYLRVADTTSVDLVLEMMKKYWRMHEPLSANLVITVIGGAKNFKLDGKKKEIFNRGLVDAAQTTHAWIITSGCNMGVMKAVGEAVAEGQTYNWDKVGMTHSLRCIGIAPWGYVERREALVSNDTHGSWNASYKVNNTIRHGQPVSLNHNHTHFLLVDDGQRNRYGGVADFRAKLERKLSMPTKPDENGETGEGIPVVLVVVEGGYDAIDDVSRSLKHRIPVVICEGTGRAADILAYAYTHFVTTRKGERKMHKRHESILEDKLCQAFGKTWAARSNEHVEAEKYTNIVMECCKDEKLITVFDMNKNEGLDLAILSALLKGQGATQLAQLRDQLKLALTWNRSDVAEEKIFNQDINWPPSSLDEIMTEALIDNKVSFVRLLLQNGLVMGEYLTVGRLRKLYNSCPKTSNLRQLLQERTRNPVFCLKDVAKLLRQLIGKHNNDIYLNDDHVKLMSHGNSGYRGDEDQVVFPEPFRELFIWAVLMNRQDMAKFLWERGEEALPSAIAASSIFGSLGNKLAHYDSDLRDSYLNNKDEFEQLAIRVLDECNNTDPEKASMLIERKYATWGEMSCLEMAANAEDREFLSSVCCQNSLNAMWKKGLACHWAKVLLALFFPFLIFTNVRFEAENNGERMTFYEKLYTFYHAPVTKFAGNVMWYLLFLLLYCYMLLFAFRETITTIEWVVIAWICTLLIEEIREMFFGSTSDSIIIRVKEWWEFSTFNKIDFIILVLALLGFILRFVPGQFIASKSVYAVNCVFLFLRVLRDYSASSYLGPKLVMITRMMQELMLYIMILVVFLLAYGVSSLSLMYPVSTFYTGVFRAIVYYPYWQLYGELYLEELEGTTDDCQGNSTVRFDGTPCPTYNPLVPILTALYLLGGNLLLLNILIAIFNHVFNEIQTNSIQIWKYGLYFLVVEYDQKPGLAPPFIIFEHIFLIIRFFVRKFCCAKKDKGKSSFSRYHETLSVFEREMLRSFIVQQDRQSKDNINTYINRIVHRVDEMAKLMEEERLLEQQHYEAEQNKLDLTGKANNLPNIPSERPTLHARRSRSKMQVFAEGGSSPRPMVHMDSVSSLDLGSTSDNLNIPGIAMQKAAVERKKYSRWPSLQTVLSLKWGKLKDIDEDKSMKFDSETDNCYRMETPQSEPMANMTTESEADYDRIDLQKMRQAPVDPTYGSIAKAPVTKIQPEAGPSHMAAPTKPSATEDSRSPKLRKRRSKKERDRLNKQTSDEERDGFVRKVTPPSLGVTPVQVTSRDDAKTIGMRHVTDGVDNANARLISLENRLQRLEESTQISLYNIEALLRNAVFYRNTPQTHVSPRRRRYRQTADYDFDADIDPLLT